MTTVARGFSYVTEKEGPQTAAHSSLSVSFSVTGNLQSFVLYVHLTLINSMVSGHVFVMCKHCFWLTCMVMDSFSYIATLFSMSGLSETVPEF